MKLNPNSFARRSVLAAALITSAVPAFAASSDYLLGDWFGYRTDLAARGVTFDFSHTFDVYGNADGGDRYATEYFGRQRFTADVDLEKLVDWNGFSFHATGVSQYGPNYAATRIGLYTTPSSIEGRETSRLGQIWVGWSSPSDRFSIKAGKLDGVAEFGLQEYGSSFMNLELAYVTNLTFANGLPFDPAGKPGVVVEYSPFATGAASGLYVKGGVFAGNDNDAYAHDQHGFNFEVRGPTVVAGEIGYRGEGVKGLPAVLKAGFHQNFGDWTDVRDGSIHDDNWLVYVNANQTLFNLDETGSRHIDAGATVSVVPEDRNSAELQITAMVRAVGPFAARPRDELGLGVVTSRFSSDWAAASVAAGGPDYDRETTVELSYKAVLRPWLIVQPDLQYVFNPRGIDEADDAFIVGLRTVINF